MSRTSLLHRLSQCQRAAVLCVLALLACIPSDAIAVTRIVDLGAWSEFDPKFFGQGVQELSGNTNSGFTSTHNGSVSEFQERPRVYQEFEGLDVSQVGQKLTASFDVKFDTMPPISDTGFRFGFGDRTSNQGLVPLMVDTQAVSGSTFRARYDDSLTDDASTFTADDYSGFLSASGTFVSGGTSPTGPGGGIVDTVATHSFIITAERVERNVDRSFPPDGIADEVVGGWYTTITWDSDQEGAEPVFADTNNSDFAAFDVDTGLGVYEEDIHSRARINNIDSLGFLIYLDDPFSETGSMGSYSISNFVLEYEDGVPLEGDYNGDGAVDAADYTVWRDTLGSTTELAADGSGNDLVDQDDYELWSGNFGGTGGGAGVSVPEPNTVLLGLGTSTLLACRRGRSSA